MYYINLGKSIKNKIPISDYNVFIYELWIHCEFLTELSLNIYDFIVDFVMFITKSLLTRCFHCSWNKLRQRSNVWKLETNMASVYPWFNFVRYFRTFLCLLGIVLSIYALYVEVRKMQDKSFTAMCDINSKMSCSRVFASK